MARIGLVALGLMVLGHLLLTQAREARADDELSYPCSRDAADAEDWIERGRASVTASPVFPDGIRLTARAVEEGEEFGPGLASAIYRFSVPAWAYYAEISVRYKDVSKDDEVAGRLWIKTVDNEATEAIDPAEEAPLYGDTFVLRSDRTSETIHVPIGRHAEEGSFELHIVAEGTDCLDVKCLRVAYLEEKPAGMRVVHHSSDDYWYSRPRHRYAYHYYYWGPCYWPRASLVYVWWDWPCGFYWHVWRPWFRLYVRAHCSHPWWGPRRYTLFYHGDPDDPPARKRALFRKRLRERHVWSPSHARTGQGHEVTSYKQIRGGKGLAAKKSLVPIHRQLKGRPAPVEKQQKNQGIKPHFLGRDDYESQRILRPKSRRVSPSYAPKKEIQGQLRSRTSPQIPRPRLENRGNTRIPAVQARDARLKNQVSGQSEIRKNSMPRTRLTTRTPPVRSRGLAFGRARR